MSQQVFAYIIHKEGVADDTALELIVAAKAIAPEASVCALVAGNGDDLQAVCADVAKTYPEVWKIENEALSYANAEVVRGLLTRIIPPGSIVLVPHEHFGMDLSPGLSIKMNAAYLPDAVAFEGFDGDQLKTVREEYSGQVSTHVQVNISGGAVITVRPGAFAADETKAASGSLVDKTAEAMEGGLPGGNRRYLEVVEAEVGDVDITKSDILVSVGRGIEDEENLENRHRAGGGYGRRRFLLAADRGCQVARKVSSGGHLRSDRETEGLSGAGDQRLLPAFGRGQGCTFYRCGEQKRQGADFSGCRHRRRRGHHRVYPGLDRKDPGDQGIANCFFWATGCSIHWAAGYFLKTNCILKDPISMISNSFSLTDSLTTVSLTLGFDIPPT